MGNKNKQATGARQKSAPYSIFQLVEKRSCVIDLKVNWDRDHFSFSGPYNAW